MKKGYTDQYVFQSALLAFTALENLKQMLTMPYANLLHHCK